MKYIFLSLATLVGSISAYAQTTNQKETTNTKKDSLNGTVLHEVVVSASREKQKRSEVPAAISVISQKELNEVKAFGVDQIVNDVPGVFVSSSKASGNEQHFTATRSPISTRALFLYLEDGLPLRPTAVFNHNALLELNSISYKRVEVLKGPASSIYGSEAVGGSFNFLTKDPSKELTGSVQFQLNDLGLANGGFEVSKYLSEKLGFYVGTQYTERNNGRLGNSDYEKFASTFKFIYDFSEKIKWTNVYDLIDYRTDTSGSLSQEDYDNENFESDQTFTERDAFAIRFRSTFESDWNSKNKTTASFVYRDNRLAQIPSFRVRQNRDRGQLTGTGSGRINDNRFNSYVGLVQHKIKFDQLKSSLIIGSAVDFSPQTYVEENTSIIVDPETGINRSFTINENDFVLDYQADILNYAGYVQFEINPIKSLKITSAIRYDRFKYDFNNRIAENSANRINDRQDQFRNFSPKFGINYNPLKNLGIYGSYSNGFTPPQTSTLYRSLGDENRNLKPTTFDNFEIGIYASPVSGLRLDLAAYSLEGIDTDVSFRDEVTGVIVNTNAGGTISRGIEYGVSFKIHDFTLSHNGSYAEHKYKNFILEETITNLDQSRTRSNRDVSNSIREVAPNWLGNSKIIYTPHQIKGLSLSVIHELVGDYNTSLEGQVINFNSEGGIVRSTETYSGHNIINSLISYKFKNVEIWGQALNIFDDLYAVRASFNTFRGENTFSLGNPRAFHVGVKYNF